jgi:FimV-like protein
MPLSSLAQDVVVDTQQDSEPVIILTPDPANDATRLKTYGPTTAQDNIWQLASKYRPDSTVTVEQMLVALNKENPRAFDHGNINSLKSGQLLKIPTLSKILEVSPEAAKKIIDRQNLAWQKSQSRPSSRADNLVTATQFAAELAEKQRHHPYSSTEKPKKKEPNFTLMPYQPALVSVKKNTANAKAKSNNVLIEIPMPPLSSNTGKDSIVPVGPNNDQFTYIPLNENSDSSKITSSNIVSIASFAKKPASSAQKTVTSPPKIVADTPKTTIDSKPAVAVKSESTPKEIILPKKSEEILLPTIAKDTSVTTVIPNNVTQQPLAKQLQSVEQQFQTYKAQTAQQIGVLKKENLQYEAQLATVNKGLRTWDAFLPKTKGAWWIIWGALFIIILLWLPTPKRKPVKRKEPVLNVVSSNSNIKVDSPTHLKDEYDFMNSDEGIAAKLDLARAYIDMEDHESARWVLKDVIAKGNAGEKKQAKQLMESIKL